MTGNTIIFLRYRPTEISGWCVYMVTTERSGVAAFDIVNMVMRRGGLLPG
ncbi:MAG: hypothetical protein HXY21_06425 [Parvularculaceae bacterium]|nr:hypothetical protein [Parvularculaceae bacterium]